jgi:tRNA(fMet)-specific endonuclease VapC
MTVRYLLDTDWVIHYLHGNPDVIKRVDEARGEGVGLSVISLAEFYEGVFYSYDPKGSEKDLTEFLRGVAIFEVDDAVCRVFGRERGQLRQEKKMIGDFDLLIAATALRHSLTLLTNNRRHFQAIEDLSIESV